MNVEQRIRAIIQGNSNMHKIINAGMIEVVPVKMGNPLWGLHFGALYYHQNIASYQRSVQHFQGICGKSEDIAVVGMSSLQVVQLTFFRDQITATSLVPSKPD